VCEEFFWLDSLHPLLEQEDLDNSAAAVRKVETAFIDNKAANIPVDYAPPEIRAML
jgi:hypothetical protein